MMAEDMERPAEAAPEEQAPAPVEIAGGAVAVRSYETVLVRQVLPVEAEGTLAETVALNTEALSPFEEGCYALGYEVVSRNAEALTVWVAMAANEVLDERWHAALQTAGKLGKARVDVSLMGWLKVLPQVAPEAMHGRKLLAIREPAEQLLMLLSEGVPEAVRAFPGQMADADFAREAMLLLSRGALEGLGAEAPEAICLAPMRESVQALQLGTGLEPRFIALEPAEAETRLGQALLERATAPEATMDLTPEAWREEASAARRKRGLIAGASILGVLWLICAAGLFLAPKVYKKLAQDVTAQIARQRRVYQAVQDLRERVALIERYQDRSNSALEMLRLLCAAKAKTMTFLSVSYRQKQQLKVSGLADDTSDVYAFKEALQQDERLQEVKITRLSQDPKTRKQRFDIDIVFPSEQEQE